MLDLIQLRTSVIRPALQGIGLWDETSENLILGTIIQESGAYYLRQLDNGPAVSFCMVEPLTYMDIRHHLLLNLALRKKILTYCCLTDIPEDVNFLIGNLSLAIIVCRLKYYFSPEPLPANNDAIGLANIWKQVYNTPLGKGDVSKAVESFKIAINVQRD